MFGEVNPPYPKYFLIVFRRFKIMTFVRSGGTVPLSLPVMPPLILSIFD